MSLKSLFKNSAIYAIATYLQRMIGFILIPFYTRPKFLSIVEYGDFNLIYTFIAFATIVFTMGQDVAFLRFRFHKNEKASNVFYTSLMNLSTLSIFFTISIILFRTPLQQFLQLTSSKYLIFAAFILTFDILNNSFYNYLRAEEKAVSFSTIKIIRFFLELVLNFIFVIGLRLGIWGILYANITSSAVNFLFLAFLGRENFKGKFSWNLSKQMLLFGLPFLPNGIAFIGTAFSDRVIIAHLINNETVGIYSASFKWGTLIQFLVLAFRNAWQPYFLKISKELPVEASKIFAKVIKTLFMGLTLLWIVGALFIGEIVKFPFPGIGAILGDPKYWQAIHIIPLIMLGYVYYGFYVSFTPGFYIKKRGHSLALVTISGFLVSFIVNIIFIPYFGFMVAAWANLAAYLTMSVLIVFWGQKIYYIPVDWKFISRVALIHIITLIFYFSIYPGIILKIVFFMAMIIAIFSLKLITKNEIMTLLNTFRGGEKK